MRRRAALIMVLAVVATGCSSDDPEESVSGSGRGDISVIEVVRSETLAPDIEFDANLEYSRTQTAVVWPGDGPRLVDGQPLLLDIYSESLEDGSTVLNTFDGLPRSSLLARELLGEALYEALTGARVGARLLHVSPAPEDSATDPPIVLVIDVLPVRAQGTDVAHRDDLPIVMIADDGEPQITIRTDAEPPSELQVARLVQGEGPQIRPGSHVLVNYKGVFWSDGSTDERTWQAGETFESSWPIEKAPFEFQVGVGGVIRGWDEGLLDQTQGSQVLLVVPPLYGYAEMGTLVFVVDVLDVWNPEQ